MDPLGGISTGGGGLSGGSSDASGTARGSNTFGSVFGTKNYNFGSGSLSANTPNYWVIGGVVAAGLLALYMWRKK